MLTQGPAPDLKCKLIILPFFLTHSLHLHISHLLDCLIFTRVWVIYMRVRVGGTGGGYHFIVFVFSYLFCILLSHVLSIFI